MQACGSNGWRSSSSLPASIFEKSRMSLMMPSRPSPLDRMVSTYSRCCGVSLVSSSRLVMPITPFMGVRISWLMLARKVLLARPAASAAVLGRFEFAVGVPHVVAQPADVAAHDGKPRQRHREHDQLEQFVGGFHRLGLELIQRKHQPGERQHGGGCQHQELARAQAENAEQESDEEDEQQRPTPTVGVVHDVGHRDHGRGDLRQGHAVVGQLEVDAGAKGGVEEGDPEQDQRGALHEPGPLEAAEQVGDTEQGDDHQGRAGGHEQPAHSQRLAAIVCVPRHPRRIRQGVMMAGSISLPKGSHSESLFAVRCRLRSNPGLGHHH